MSEPLSVSVGDVFAVRVRPGLYGLAHVVRAERPRGAWDKAGRWTVVTCAWTGPRTGITAALRKPASLLPVKGRGFGGRLGAQSIGGPPPPEVRKVGSVPPSAAVKRFPKLLVGAWQWIALKIADALDPEAMRRRMERVRTESKRRLAARRADEKLRLAAAKKARTLPVVPDRTALLRLARTPALASWSKEHPKAFVATVRKALGTLAKRLAELAPKTAAPVLTELAAVTRALGVHRERIMTPDAEELHEALVAIAEAAGCDGDLAAGEIDRVRRW